MRRLLILLPPFAWLLLLVAAPLAILAVIALAEAGPGVPPFLPPVVWRGGPVWQGSVESLGILLTDRYYLDALLQSLGVALGTAALCLLLAYPMALGIAAARAAWRMPLLLLVLLPFWTGFLPRLGAWIGILRDGGWVNGLLGAMGLAPLRLLYTDAALYLGMVHAYLPFAVLPLAAALLRRDPAIEEAAADLGATPWVVFRSITLPLSLPAAAAGFLLVFIPAAGEFVHPGTARPARGATGRAGAVGGVLPEPGLAAGIGAGGGAAGAADPADQAVPAAGGQAMKRLGLACGLGFLWAPVLLMSWPMPSVPTAFPSSGVASRCAGLAALAADARMREAAWLSLRIAAGSATLAVLLGGLVGWALARFGAFRGRAVFGALAGAPLVLPEVVAGPVAAAALRRAAGCGGALVRLATRPRRRHHPAGACDGGAGLCRGGGAGPAGRAGPRPGGSGGRSRGGAVHGVPDHHPAVDRPRRWRPAGCWPSPVAGRCGDRQLRLRPGRDHPADAGLFRAEGGLTPEVNALAGGGSWRSPGPPPGLPG